LFARTLKKQVFCLAHPRVIYTKVRGRPIFHWPKGNASWIVTMPQVSLWIAAVALSAVIPLCLPISFNPLVHVVDEEASPALLKLSLLEEDFFGDGMGLRHNPLLMSGGKKVEDPL
jgi:hypothetical protein